MGIPSGEQLEKCSAIHAEQMAINRAATNGINILGTTMYITSFPCLMCAKQIAGLSLSALVVLKGVYGQDSYDILKGAGLQIRTVDPKRVSLPEFCIDD